MLAAQLVRRVTEVALKDRLHISIGRASRAGFLIDLASVYLGFGIFTANGVFEQKWSDGWKYEWVARRSGSLSEAEYGHLLAVYAAARGEKNPGWAKYLDGNVRVAFRASEKELQRTQRADALKVCG